MSDRGWTALGAFGWGVLAVLSVEAVVFVKAAQRMGGVLKASAALGAWRKVAKVTPPQAVGKPH